MQHVRDEEHHQQHLPHVVALHPELVRVSAVVSLLPGDALEERRGEEECEEGEEKVE